MDPHDFFRRFFGFHSMRHDRFDDAFFGNHPENNNEQDDIKNFRDSGDFFPGVTVFVDSDESFPSLFRRIEDMSNSMFSNSAGFLDFPNFEMSPEPADPRDLMLKDSGCKNCNVSQVPAVANQNPIVYDVNQVDCALKTKPTSFFQSVSTKFIRTADGAVEEHRTVTDSSGKTVTTVTKSLGDKTYKVTTESDNIGLLEKKEDFINMDESDKTAFENQLSQRRRNLFGIFSNEPKPESDLVVPPAPPGDPSYMSIFKKLFGT